MIEIKKQNDCSGCAACANVCPSKAITLVPDESGFLYPNIDVSKCVDCSLCNSVCQIELKAQREEYKQEFFALVNNNDKHLKKSSSGGAFLAVAEYVFDNGGVVVGCTFDKELKAVHTVTYNLAECIEKLCGSKYVQSEIKYTYGEVKQLLKSGKLVLYVGTPCQIEGLLLFLKNKPANLITMDLICHGVSSPLLWKKHKEYLESKIHKTINKYYFRSKKREGWSLYYYYYYGKNRCKHGSSFLDRYYLDFLKGVNYRESCYICRYANLNRVGDITVGDFWGAENYIDGIDLNSGVSLVIINSSVGNEIINRIKDNVWLQKVSMENAVKENQNLVRPTVRPKEREKYYSECFSDLKKWETEYVKTKRWKKENFKSKIPICFLKIKRRLFK